MSLNPLGGEFPKSFRSLQGEMNDLLDRFYHGGICTGPFDGQEWAPAMDMMDFGDHYKMFLEVAGLGSEEVDLSLLGSELTVRGDKKAPEFPDQVVSKLHCERKFGSFCRKVQVPGDVNPDSISARCVNGILEVTLNKSTKDLPRAITVSAEE